MNPIYHTDSQQAEYDEMLLKKKIKAEKKEIARVKSCVKTAEYQSVHREWTNNYQKNRYHTNDAYRKNKSLQAAYARYLNGVNVSNHIVDLLKEAGYGHLPYRKKVY